MLLVTNRLHSNLNEKNNHSVHKIFALLHSEESLTRLNVCIFDFMNFSNVHGIFCLGTLFSGLPINL